MKGPTQLDKATRLDKTVAGPGHRITYILTLTELSSGDVSKSMIESLYKHLHRSACDDPSMQLFFVQKVTAVFEYHASDGPLIGKFEIDSTSCVPANS